MVDRLLPALLFLAGLLLLAGCRSAADTPTAVVARLPTAATSVAYIGQTNIRPDGNRLAPLYKRGWPRFGLISMGMASARSF